MKIAITVKPEPPNNDYLSITTTILGSRGWPLCTDLTVIVISEFGKFHKLIGYGFKPHYFRLMPKSQKIPYRAVFLFQD